MTNDLHEAVQDAIRAPRSWWQEDGQWKSKPAKTPNEVKLKAAKLKRARKLFIERYYFVTQAAFTAMYINDALPGDINV